MDVRWSKGCDIPTSESSHVQPLTIIYAYINVNNFICIPVNSPDFLESELNFSLFSKILLKSLKIQGFFYFHLYYSPVFSEPGQIYPRS